MKVLAAIDADTCNVFSWADTWSYIIDFFIWLPSNSDSKTVQNYEEIVQNYEDVVMGFFANFML
jgi:hypothetical protein